MTSQVNVYDKVHVYDEDKEDYKIQAYRQIMSTYLQTIFCLENHTLLKEVQQQELQYNKGH